MFSNGERVIAESRRRKADSQKSAGFPLSGCPLYAFCFPLERFDNRFQDDIASSMPMPDVAGGGWFAVQKNSNSRSLKALPVVELAGLGFPSSGS